MTDNRPTVAMLVFPGLTLLDLIGPQTAFAPVMDVTLVAKTVRPLASDTGVTVMPDVALADADADYDVIFVPGGGGAADAMVDDETLAFLADRASRARYVTSVCLGSLVLGAAGLLRGYRATSHWTAVDLLPLFGAEPAEGRVVVDRNRVTGGGVTAGLDFGLSLIATMLGRPAAELSQLMMEYDPQPPFAAGDPATASPAIVAQVREFTRPFTDAVTARSGSPRPSSAPPAATSR